MRRPTGRRRTTRTSPLAAVVLLACLDIEPQAPAPSPPRVLGWVFAFGDWGTGGSGQHRVAAQLERAARVYKPSLVLLLGDNFYERGVTGVEDPRWHTLFESMYNGPALQVPFWAVFGNHDYLTQDSPDAQVAYTAMSSRWRMPAPYYTFVDTVAVIGPDIVSVRYVGLDTDAIVRNVGAARQLLWLDSVLAQHPEDWTIVFGHHPLYGSGVYGDTPVLHTSLRPIFEKRGVHVYLAAHAHNLQVPGSVNGVTYLISGGGAGSDRRHAVSAGDRMPFAAVRGGFTALGFARDAAVILMIDDEGHKLFQLILTNPAR